MKEVVKGLEVIIIVSKRPRTRSAQLVPRNDHSHRGEVPAPRRDISEKRDTKQLVQKLLSNLQLFACTHYDTLRILRKIIIA